MFILQFSPFTLHAPEGEASAGTVASAAQAPAQAPAQTITPINEGGAELNLRQAGEAIGNMGLIGGEDYSDDGEAGDVDESADDDADDSDSEGNQTEVDAADDDQTDGGDDSEQSDAKESDESTDDSDSDDETPIESLADLTSALELENSDLLDNLTDTFNADGEEITVTLAEMRKSYQKDANYRRQTQELAETRQAMDTEHTQALDTVKRELVQVGQILQYGQQMLLGEVNTPEMQQLRVTNPAEWSARQAEYSQRAGQMNQLYQNISQQYEEHHQKEQAQVKTDNEALRQREYNTLTETLPDWTSGRSQKVTTYLNAFGFENDELANVLDSRQFIIADKAMKYDELMAASVKTKKKIVNVPKAQKPGKGGAQGPSKQSVNLKRAQKRLQSSGKLGDAAALIDLVRKD